MDKHTKTLNFRNTAERLDRFKKPDGWAQRRVEENFAMFAACMDAATRGMK